MLKRVIGICYLVFCLCILSSASKAEPVVAGYLEWAWFDGNRVPFKAKLDTGADNSSINAPDFEVFRKGGKGWVRFEIENEKGKPFLVEKQIVRVAQIKKQVSGTKDRYVIMLHVCVAGVSSEVEFNLANREKMTYQILIGRSFLQSNVLVDSGRTFIGNDKCKK